MESSLKQVGKLKSDQTLLLKMLVDDNKMMCCETKAFFLKIFKWKQVTCLLGWIFLSSVSIPILLLFSNIEVVKTNMPMDKSTERIFLRHKTKAMELNQAF